MATSAEPGRKAPYSSDLRWRIIWQKFGMGLTYRQVAKNLNISLGTSYNICRKFEESGSVSPATHVEYRRLLNGQQELWIMGLLLHNPSLYLGEICQKIAHVFEIQVSPATVCRIIRRHGFTRKKIQQVASQRSSEYRAAFVSEALTFDADKFVWVDETGCDRRDQVRKLGYALRGERPAYHRLLHRGNRISSIAALSTDGVVAIEITKGTLDGEKFADFVRGKLIPEMLPFDGENCRSIVVLDNCSIHHVSEVEDLFKQAGILVLFLAPYSPDLNPAEELFSYIKYYLKAHDEVLQVMDDPVPLIQGAFESVTADMCTSWIRHSGY